MVLYGDQALLELGARRAAHLDQIVGPYSRQGFHHPGPAVFYLLAPFVRLLKPAGSGLYLGAVAINGATLVATVAVVWRRYGAPAALWASAAIDLFALCVGVGTLREPWNPYLVLMPMLLFVVLWAATVDGSRAAAVWTLVVGSFEIQTHIATAGFVAPMSGFLLARVVQRAWWRRHRRPEHIVVRQHWGPARITGFASLALIWLAPALELWRDRPNNAILLWDYFSTPHADPSLRQSLRLTADVVTIMPWGNQDYVLALRRTPAELVTGAVILMTGIAVAGVLGRRRRQPVSVALAASGILGLVLGASSLYRAAGPLYLYFAVWLSFVPLAILIAIGVALLGPTAADDGPGVSRRAIAVCVLAAIVTAALAVGGDLRDRPVGATTGSGPWPEGRASSPQGRLLTLRETAALTRAAESVLEPTDRWVGIAIGTSSLWPYVAGMVAGLDERGVQSTVGPASWELYFGHERAPGRRVAISFDLFMASDIAAVKASRGTVVARFRGDVLTYRRTSS